MTTINSDFYGKPPGMKRDKNIFLSYLGQADRKCQSCHKTIFVVYRVCIKCSLINMYKYTIMNIIIYEINDVATRYSVFIKYSEIGSS